LPLITDQEIPIFIYIPLYPQLPQPVEEVLEREGGGFAIKETMRIGPPHFGQRRGSAS